MTSVPVDHRVKTATGSRVASKAEADELTLANVVAGLSSLKFTVTLFAMTIVLVFAGTLAQVEKDIWQVVDEYFRTWVTWIDLQLFFPASFFPSQPRVPGGFYFPGGWLLGALMMVNLFAAHWVRFTFQARGLRLAAGLAAIAAGVALTVWIIVAGAAHDSLAPAWWSGWTGVWRLFQATLAVASGVMLFRAWKIGRDRTMERRLLVASAGTLLVTLAWTLYAGAAGRLDDSSLRILWQLGKGTLAGLVTLAGCVLVFRKRAGIVLLHGGIGLLMFGELLVGLTAVEGRMHIREGEAVNYVYDIHNLELAVIDKSEPGRHDVVSIPESLLRGERIIRSRHLPFDIEVVHFLENARLQLAGPALPNAATAGVGLQWLAESIRPVSGTDTGGAINQSAAYLRLLDKTSGQDLGTRLVALVLSSAELPDKVEVDGKTHHLYLRFKRSYKPYSMTLTDVRKEDYPGTNTPRSYSSDVRLVNSSDNVDRKAKIWMNNPLRFGGETFYQSGYFRDPETGFESTTLSVVSNGGWMLPYVGCMIVATGLLAHFCGALLRFLNRQTGRQEMPDTMPGQGEAGPETRGSRPPVNWLSWIVPAAIVLVFAGWVGGQMRPPRPVVGEMRLDEFSKLPVLYQGRAKPFDTLARNSLRILSDRQTFTDQQGARQPAVRWLLDVIARPEEAAEHPVFRIENQEVLDALELERRSGFRYSFAELEPSLEELRKQARLTRSIPADELSVYQKKILALDNKLSLLDLLVQSFVVPAAAGSHAESPTAHETTALETTDKETTDKETTDKESTDKETAAEKAAEEKAARMRAVLEQQQKLAGQQPPLMVPPRDGETSWQAYSTAWAQNQMRPASAAASRNVPLDGLTAMFAAYAADDTATFNREVRAYREALAAEVPPDLNLARTNFEAYFNHCAPFYHAAALYVVAFVLVALSWLGGRGGRGCWGWTGTLNRAAFWLILLTLAIHTAALVARIYISGRPPVTNLYSSAVFIGWGCVVLGVALERMYRMGIGNVICSVTGFSTLVIAHFLAGDGDTFAVLQAVLDTQFWLTTHVVCITLGYATTFVAGALGVIYILRGVLTPSLTEDTGRQLGRMIHGTLCFSLLFSFIGTVLGGLWADDSWGRFWGWDPKENGALIIVLWNALVLHARWGGLVRQRGLAVLAVAGNIAVSWSWFGVNELGVGLHSYGFTEGVLQSLGIFVLSQLAVMGLGLLPDRAWWSVRRHNRLAGADA